MIGESRADYVFIRICIIGLHSVAPLCLLYCATSIALYGFRRAATSPVVLIIESAVAAEALFYVAVYLPCRYYLQREAVHPPAPSREERGELFRRCNDNIPDAEAYLRKWFLAAELKEIRRENVKEFLLWAFFNRGGPPGTDNEELEEYVDATEKLLGRPIEEGRGSATCLRLTLDRVPMLHRSLLWYFVSQSLETVAPIANAETVCWICRLSDLHETPSPWLSLPPHAPLAVLYTISLSATDSPYQVSLARETHDLLAPTAHFADKVAGSVYSRYWDWTLSVHEFPW